MTTRLFLRQALLPTGWADDVLVIVDGEGMIESVEAGAVPSQDCVEIGNTVVPGMPNCHSHAHQRAMAGLGERATLDADGSKATDSFWTWRKVMYHYLERIQPDHLHAIAAQLYVEMLKAGYTNIAEFQYLHHDIDGSPYANPAEMTAQCLDAARRVGIGFTALPVLYRFGGFGEQAALEGQRRFLNDADGYCKIVASLQSHSSNLVSVGIAPHSLRAVSQPLLQTVLDSLGVDNLAAVHIHVAEQTREVEDCQSWSGERPVEWMLNRFDVNESWCAIHATHMTDEETRGLAQSGAVAGLCPTTEGNLGDGFFNLGEYIGVGGNWAIGSDSHISISPVEELRWLEYGQRLLHRQRNFVASADAVNTGMALYCQALEGGRQSAGLPIGCIAPGCRADLVVLNDVHPRLAGRSCSELMDSWIFSGNENPVLDVYVAGQKVVEGGHHNGETKIAARYNRTLAELAND